MSSLSATNRELLCECSFSPQTVAVQSTLNKLHDGINFTSIVLSQFSLPCTLYLQSRKIAAEFCLTRQLQNVNFTQSKAIKPYLKILMLIINLRVEKKTKKLQKLLSV
jgi:hypothetical protein